MTTPEKRLTISKQASFNFAPSAAVKLNHHTNPSLRLQGAIGNQVQRMLLVPGEEVEVDSIGIAASNLAHDFSRIPVSAPVRGKILTKLTVNTPGDIYEQQADAVAEQVIRMPAPDFQRQIEPAKFIQRKTIGEAHVKTPPPIVHKVLGSAGQQMDAFTRGFMEPRFGHDFSRVRVHTDNEAASSAHAIGARAYTVGQHIVFGPQQYDMGRGDGLRLLAHELTHILQSPEHGAADELVKRDKDKKPEDPVKKTSKCQMAQAQIRPVFFRNDPGKTDSNPTGKSLDSRLKEASRIWGKCGVEFKATEPKMVEDSESKIAGKNDAELNSVQRAYGKKGTGPQVFFLDNDLSVFGGGRTGPNVGDSMAIGDDAKIMLSDHGSNDRLLAHELGHAMGLLHPDVMPYIPNNSIMQPTGAGKTNPDLVTDKMCRVLTWPAKLDEKCWHVDPDNKATFDKP